MNSKDRKKWAFVDSLLVTSLLVFSNTVGEVRSTISNDGGQLPPDVATLIATRWTRTPTSTPTPTNTSTPTWVPGNDCVSAPMQTFAAAIHQDMVNMYGQATADAMKRNAQGGSTRTRNCP